MQKEELGVIFVSLLPKAPLPSVPSFPHQYLFGRGRGSCLLVSHPSAHPSMSLSPAQLRKKESDLRFLSCFAQRTVVLNPPIFKHGIS